MVYTEGTVHTAQEKFIGLLCFVSMVRRTVDTTPSRKGIRAWRKSCSNRRNLKTPAFRFFVDAKYLENGAFRKR